jgi:hypothetical protein
LAAQALLLGAQSLQPERGGLRPPGRAFARSGGLQSALFAGEGFAYLSCSSNSFAHIMFCVRETAAAQ